MTLRLIPPTPSTKAYATLGSPHEVVATTQDFLDFIAWACERDTNLVLLAESNLPEAFYDLSTRLAGEILQKLSNYRVRLAIVGTFGHTSERFQEFKRESNKGRHVYFVATHAEAVAWLSS